jgi:hypothetical protein
MPPGIHSIRNQAGAVLLTTVLLIVVASVSIYGVTVFIVERLAASTTRAAHLETVYLAQAGVHQALYEFRAHDLSGNGYFSLGQTLVSSGDYFVVGGTEADFLMVNPSQTVLGGQYTPQECKVFGKICTNDCDVARAICDEGCVTARDQCNADAYAIYDACVATCPPGPSGNACRNACKATRTAAIEACSVAWEACKTGCVEERALCRDDCTEEQQNCIDGTKITTVYLQNATDSQSITIDRMIVSWDNASLLQQVVINGQLLWSGSSATTADADLSPNFTLDSSQTVYTLDFLQYSATMADATTAIIEFVMSDGSSKGVTIYPTSNHNDFTVKATGKTAQPAVYRTIAATYNPTTGEVIDVEEIDTEITP